MNDPKRMKGSDFSFVNSFSVGEYYVREGAIVSLWGK